MSIMDKLKLNKYTNLAVINQPSDYDIFTTQTTQLSANHDAIFIFIETMDEMVSYTQQVIKEELLAEKGYLFFAYPKKGNKRFETYIHRDEIFPKMNVGEDGYIGDSDLKFSRMVSMDDTYTVVGLKREKKKAKKSTAASQCVKDYEHQVNDIEALLADHPEELTFFQSLTPGYQKSWARHIFSAKQQSTRDKRKDEMIDILAQKYKSIDLYRQKDK